MFFKLIQTPNDRVATLTRLFLGAVMFPHGWQKITAFSLTMDTFGMMGIPAFFSYLAIMAEFLGSIALIVGLLGRVGAFGIAMNMIMAIFLVHLPNGFFMNWSGMKAGEGFEYHILVIGLALAVMIRGSGALSLDLAFSRKPELREVSKEEIEIKRSA